MAAPETVDVAIESIAAGGDGVGRAEGMVVFTPRTAPGDLARVRVRASRRFARGSLDRVLTPGPGRIDPPCPHYTRDRCGGCQIQHLSYEAQVDAKRRIIEDALRRIAKREIQVPPVVGSDAPWRYRRKLTLAIQRVGNDWIAGLHPYDDPIGVFRLDDCPITDERVVAAWKEILERRELFPEARSLRGAVQLTERGATFSLEGGRQWRESETFFEAVPSLVGLWWRSETGHRRLLHERGDALGGASFAQVNATVAAALRARLLERVRAYTPATVVDAYAGSGNTAVPLAESGITVTAIELDREAARRCAERLPAGSRAISARVEDALPDALPGDVVIVNPPRVGLDERVPPLLEGARSTMRALFYVSCDPATLARDIARLPGFRLAGATGFDMFPQTAHVETLCELVPEAA